MAVSFAGGHSQRAIRKSWSNGFSIVHAVLGLALFAWLQMMLLVFVAAYVALPFISLCRPEHTFLSDVDDLVGAHWPGRG
jgi:hypothetical protein